MALGNQKILAVFFFLIPLAVAYRNRNNNAHLYGRVEESDVDRCAQFGNDIDSCRQNSCSFSCYDNVCKDKPDICGSECHAFCYNPCECKKNGCNYNVKDSMCRQRIPICRPEKFTEKSCFRSGTFYVQQGEVCRMTFERGVCSIQNLMAVNFFGEDETGADGMLYYGYQNSKATVFGKKRYVGGKYRSVTGVDSSELALYQTYVEPFRKDPAGWCVGITFDISRTGFYEVGFKSVDWDYIHKGDRFFSIEINEKRLVETFDILSYVEVGQGIHVIIKFEVIPGFIKGEPTLYVDGFPNIKLKYEQKTTSFTLCESKCKGTRKSLPTVSAMYANFLHKAE